MDVNRVPRSPVKLAAALHALGFDDVFDTNFAADLTILEEGTGAAESAERCYRGRWCGTSYDYQLQSWMD